MSGMFFTEQGIEVPAVTAAKMREIDSIAIEKTGPNLFQMMENAGYGSVGFCLSMQTYKLVGLPVPFLFETQYRVSLQKKTSK